MFQLLWYIMLIPIHQAFCALEAPEQQTTQYLYRGPSFWPEEQDFVAERKKLSCEHLNSLFFKESSEKLTPDEIPVIAVVGSGGGYRAMIATTGFVRGLEEISVLPTATYIAGLSGSTWFLAPWILKNKSLLEFSHQLKKNVQECFELRHFNPTNIIKYLLGIEKKYKHKPTLCDGWGAALGSIFFKEESSPSDQSPAGSQYTLNSLREKLNPQKHPFPIFTAIFSKSKPYEWIEFTPYAVGSAFIDAQINSTMLGTYFFKGEPQLKAQALTLPYLLGLFGSAYAAEFGQSLDFALDQIEANLPESAVKKFKETFKYIQTPLQKVNQITYSFFNRSQQITQILWQKVWGKSNQSTLATSDIVTPAVQEKYRISPPIIPNFTRGLEPALFKDDYYYTLIDAGIDFNIPLPPLLERQVDLFIVFDSSSNTALLDTKNHALIGARTYATRKGYTLPALNSLEDIGIEPIEKRIKILIDNDDPQAPIIIYIPNTVSVTTAKFSYSGQEYDDLEQSAYQSTCLGEKLIKEAISKAIERKKKLKKTYEYATRHIPNSDNSSRE